MKLFLTISAIFLTLLQLQAQVKSQKSDSLAQHIVVHVDSAALKINKAADKIKSGMQRSQRIVEEKLKGEFTNSKVEVDSTVLMRKNASDKIKFQVQQAEHKFDSIMQAQSENKINHVLILDSANKIMDAGVDRFNAKSRAVEHWIDSINQKVIDGVHAKLSGVDSVKKKMDRLESKLDQAKAGVQQKQNHYTDSINTLVQKYQQKLRTNALTRGADSVKNMAQPLGKYKSKLDSIGSVNPLQKTQSGVAHAQAKIQGITNEPKAKIDEKLSLLSKESGGKGNLPGGANITTTDLSSVTGKITNDIKLPNTGLDAKASLNVDPKLTALDKSSIKSPDLSVDKELNTKQNLAKGLDKTSDLNKLNDLKKGADEVTKASGKLTGYTDDIKNIEKGDLEKVKTLKEDAIAKLPVNNELTEIQKQDKLIKEQAAKLQSFKNPEEFKKQTIARSNEVIAQQVAVYSKQIQAVVDKVSKNQSKLGTVLGYSKDLPKQRDRLKKLKLYEKFVPGITLQIQKPGGAWIVDFNPALRYRLTSYWSVGLGWNERALFGKYSKPYDQVRIYGPRSFTEVVIFRGVSFRLDAEDMNVMRVLNPQTQDTGKRLWVWSYMAGIKKEFSFVPYVIGNVQFMYNLHSSNNTNPYLSAFNVRFGFEYLAKKKANNRNK